MSKVTHKLIYLASPYTDKDVGLRELRAKEVARLAGTLIENGHNIFCPIAHSHYIAYNSQVAAAGDAGKRYDKNPVHLMWMRVDLSVLQHCDEMWVYMLPGWGKSKGVKEEIEFCKEKGIPVTYLDFKGQPVDTSEVEEA